MTPGADEAGTNFMAAAVTVVIPTYNEAANVGPLVEDLLGLGMTGLRVLIVDDNSPDGTGEAAERLRQRHPEVGVIHRRAKSGFGSAYREGLARAAADNPEFVVMMDGDRSHPVSALRSMMDRAGSCDVVVGSRYTPGGCMPGGRWNSRGALSRMANAYARTLSPLSVRDATAGYRVLRTAALPRIEVGTTRSTGYAFLLELAWRCERAGLRIAEVPISFHPRASGKSKLSRSVILESALTPLRLRLSRWPPKPTQH
jgi:dolichol-phosphate mannosyltransferase